MRIVVAVCSKQNLLDGLRLNLRHLARASSLQRL
jgi:hypothetical protein